MTICPYCNTGDVSVEIFGFAVHKLTDRWVACPTKSPVTPFQRGVIAIREELTRGVAQRLQGDSSSERHAS
jgi:hypothetical protein